MIEGPAEKFKNELRACYNRWWEESDLDEEDMIKATEEVVSDVFEVEISFDCEIDLEADADD